MVKTNTTIQNRTDPLNINEDQIVSIYAMKRENFRAPSDSVKGNSVFSIKYMQKVCVSGTNSR